MQEIQKPLKERLDIINLKRRLDLLAISVHEKGLDAFLKFYFAEKELQEKSAKEIAKDYEDWRKLMVTPPGGSHHENSLRKIAREVQRDKNTIRKWLRFLDSLQSSYADDFSFYVEQETPVITEKWQRKLLNYKKYTVTPDLKGKYRVIYVDPPWQYDEEVTTAISDTWNKKEYGAAEKHMPTMPLDEICALPVKDISTPNSVLFFWTTAPMLMKAKEVVRAWGFDYKASFVWDKVKHNFGYYNSVRHELLLLATRGSCRPDNPILIDSVQTIERTKKHSAKPSKFREIIDELYPEGNRIELFAREKTLGWDAWGDEI